MIDRAASERDWTRRRWLAGLTVVGLGALGGDAPQVKPTTDPAEVGAIRRRASKAGLEPLGSSETENYVAIGDAPDDFREGALKVCEGLARTLQTHLLTKGITIVLPSRRMAVVVLAGRASYEAFKGEAVAGTEGGHYDLETNRLVIFQTDVPQVNTFTLVHEATHQITYNTGLLSRQGDVPVAISEGFAAYGEVWRVSRPSLARPNALRLAVLRNPGGGGPRWISMEKLLTDDGLFGDETTAQLAYAESWLLIYDLLQTSADARKLRAYLAAIALRRDPGHRVSDAEKAFGDLGRFDAGLRQSARRLR